LVVGHDVAIALEIGAIVEKEEKTREWSRYTQILTPLSDPQSVLQ